MKVELHEEKTKVQVSMTKSISYKEMKFDRTKSIT